jgi:hypothetical protein
MDIDDEWMDVDNEVEVSEPTRHETPEFQPPPTTSGRHRRFPRHYKDFLPNSTTSIPHMPPKPPIPKTTVTAPRSPSPLIESPEPTPISSLQTDPDEFGVYRLYTTYPITNPDEIQDLEGRCDAPGLAIASGTRNKLWWSGFGRMAPDFSLQNAHDNFFAPFLNATVFRLMNWFYSGSSTKSVAELQSLVDEVILAPDFKVSDLSAFNSRQELRRLDGHEKVSGTSSKSPLTNRNGWRESTVKIKLPAEKVSQREDDAPVLEIPGVYHRSLIEVVTTALQDDNAKKFHYTPFSLYWQPTPDSTPERLYSEIYNSDAFLEEHATIMQLPPEPGPHYEHAIAAMMIWSDSTGLGQFGTASVWPIYAFFGNQSKYDRAKPSQFAAHHVAYMPSARRTFSAALFRLLISHFQLPDNFQDHYTELFDQPASSGTITHLKREIFQKIWELLLDSEFLEAYEHGIVLKCADGVVRRIFPRFFTYSADYPEKYVVIIIIIIIYH